MKVTRTKVKWVLILLAAVVVLVTAMTAIDLGRTGKGQPPRFCLRTGFYLDGSSRIYKGPGYTVVFRQTRSIRVNRDLSSVEEILVGPEFSHWIFPIAKSNTHTEIGETSAPPDDQAVLKRLIPSLQDERFGRIESHAEYDAGFTFGIYLEAPSEVIERGLKADEFHASTAGEGSLPTQRSALQFASAPKLPDEKSIRWFAKADRYSEIFAVTESAGNRLWIYEREN